MILKPLYLYVTWQSNTYVKHLCVWIVYEYFSQAELKYNLTNNCLQFKNSYSKFLKQKKFQIFLEFTKLVCSFSWQFSFFFLASSRYFAYSKFLAYKLTQIYSIRKNSNCKMESPGKLEAVKGGAKFLRLELALNCIRHRISIHLKLHSIKFREFLYTRFRFRFFDFIRFEENIKQFINIYIKM